MKRILFLLSAFVAPMFCNDAIAQTDLVEVKFDINMSLASSYDNLNIKELSSELGLKDKFYAIKTPYVKISKTNNTSSYDIAYAEIWDDESHIKKKDPKSVSTFKSYTFCKVETCPKLFKWSVNNQNGSFYLSPYTVSADNCKNWVFNTIRTKSDDRFKVHKMTTDSVFIQGDSIVSITFTTGCYSLVESVLIGDKSYAVGNKDHFLEGCNLTVPCNLMLSLEQFLPIEYSFLYLENGELVTSTRDVASLNITRYVEEPSSSSNWIWFLILPVVAIILFFVIKIKKVKSIAEANSNETNEPKTPFNSKLKYYINSFATKLKDLFNGRSKETNEGIATKQETGENGTSQQGTTEANSSNSNVSDNDPSKENSNESDQKVNTEDADNSAFDETSGNQSISNNKGKEKIALLSKFVENVTSSGAIIEPNQEIRGLIDKCREALLNESANKYWLELADSIKKSPFSSTYQLAADFSSISGFSTYLENLISIIKSQEENSFNAKKAALEEQLESKESENKEYVKKNIELSGQKKTAEDNLEKEKKTNASLQEKISSFEAQVASLTSQVEELINAEPEKVSFASLEPEVQEEIKEQIKQQICENYQLAIDAKQTELNIAQGSIKNLNALIDDLRTKLSSEKDERIKEQGVYSGELEQIGEKHLSEISELNARHKETLDQQKSLHDAEKAEWEHHEEELNAKIKKGEETLKEKLSAVEEAKTRAVKEAIAETVATERLKLDKEIQARKEEREQCESRIQQIEEDNAKEKEAIQKKMQKMLDQAISDCDEVFNDRKGERQMLAFEMQQHIARMYQQLTIAFNSSVGNFKTEGVELITETESMYNWYQSAVVTPFQTEDSLTQSEIVEIVQSHSIKQVQDKYSLVSRLSRIVAYSQISSLWIEWMSKQGVNTLALRMAYNEMLALMGRCKITLVVPSLYSDIYSKNDIYTLNMSFAPIVNFCPTGFDHLKSSDSTIVRDLSHPGYALDGQIKVGPEVLAQ